MTRILTANTTAEKNTRLGTEPNIILQINWASGTEYYGYKTFSLGGWSVQGSILDFSAVSSQGKQDVTGEVSSVNLTLDDSDGTIKTKVDTQVLEGTRATVYHHYESLAQSDLVVLLKGRIAGDIEWIEGDRTLSFDIEDIVEDSIYGYAPQSEDFADLWDDAIGVPWPLAYGTAIRVPAVRVKNRPVGSLLYGINQNFASFEVERGDEFPQSTPINIKIGAIKFTGSFDDTTFTPTAVNKPYHTNIPIAQRLTYDPHFLDASVMWLASTTVNLVGLYCIIDHSVYGWMVNKCFKQEGRKCYFLKPWRPSNTTLEILLHNPETIDETAPVPRITWAETYTIEHIAQWFNSLVSYVHETVVALSWVVGGQWSIQSGTKVDQEVAYNNLYVANLVPSSEILEVLGYRNFDGERILAPIPLSYYTKNLSDTLGSQTPTTLEFSTNLEDYLGEDWDGSVYVSLRSTKGPNVADVLRHLFETYTSLTVDDTSFNSVRAKITKYPAGFALLNQGNVLDVTEEIAWQARCALYIANDIVYLKYLSEVPTSAAILNEPNIVLKSMVLGFTSTEDIYTKIIANWQKNYTEEEGAERQWLYSNNISTYGLRESERDFFIYNVLSLVQLSAGFWGYRYSNSWRLAKINSFLTMLALQSYDAITYSVGALSSNSILGVIDLVNHDAVDNVIGINAQLASKAGDVDGGNNPDEDSNFFTGDPSYPIGPSNPFPSDPGNGLEEVEYSVPTSGQTNSDPNSDPGNTSDPDDPEYILEFTSEPEEVQRGVNFNLAVRIKDTLGNTISRDVSATLSLQVSPDTGETLGTTTIDIINGLWVSDTMQITGGSGSATGNISVFASNYTGDETQDFDIIPAKADSLVWASIPASVIRNAVIPNFTLSGGLDTEIIDILLNSADPNDKLYNSSDVEITSITLGPGGTYSFSGTYISGGSGPDTGNFVADDQLDKYDNKESSVYPITGLSPVTVTTAISFDSLVEADKDYLDISQSGGILDEEAFTLNVLIKKPDGTTATTYDKTIRLEAYDNATGDILNWIDAGPDANNYSSFILATMLSGVWTFDEVKIEVPPATEVVRVAAWVDGEEDLFYDELTATSTPVVFTISIPSTITRGASFNMVLQATNNGEGVSTYVPPGNVDFTLSGTGLNGETIAPTYTDNTGWSNGTKTVTVTIDNGTGSKVITVNAED